MSDSRLNFLLTGRDQLSRVLDRAGDAAQRLQRRLLTAATSGNSAMNNMTRDADGRLRDLQGRFATSQGAISRSMDAIRGSLLSLAPAAIPAAAGIAGALAPVVAQTAAAGAAAAAYAVALGPQVSALGDASEAEKKYKDAVEESGAQSKEAVTAHVAYARQMAKLPPATREAAAALSVLKDEYKDWSDSLAADTMAPVTKSFAVLGAVLPRLTPMVKGVSVELDRLVTLAGGAVSTPGFDRLMAKFTEFSTGAVRRATDGLVTFLERLDSGTFGGGALAEFMDYARTQGPLVGATLRNIGEALANVLRAGSEVGVGLLQVVNVIAALVAAVPPGAIAAFLQLALAIKAVKLAAVGLAAARGAVAAFAVQIAAMRTAAAGATGRMAAMTAAFGAMSRGAKLAVAGTGIGLLLIALTSLADRGRAVAPDVDRMTTSLGEFARTGKVSGEMAKTFGADLGKLGEHLRVIARPSLTQQIEQSVSSFLGYGEGGPGTKEAAEALDAVDKALSNLVSGGKADLAAVAFERVKASLKEQGFSAGEITKEMGDYQQALANAAFEQQLIADSMGLFGSQAMATKSKLDAQKASADGLRQAIQELNNVNRQGIGGMIGFEASIDAATKAAQENAGALSMSGGQLNLNSEKARNAATALNDLAAKTDEAAGAARESGASWSTVNGIYERGREKLLASAQAMGLTRDQAKQLADQILQTPDKTAKLKGNMEDLQRKLDNAKAQLKKVPDSRKAAIRAQIDQLNAAIAEARRKLDALDGKVVETHVVTYYQSKTVNPGTGGPGGFPKHAARGGLIRRYAAGGGVQFFPGGGTVFGPGTGTSDSIPAMLSDGEYVIRASSVDKYGPQLLSAINEARLPMPMVRPTAAPMVTSAQGAAGVGAVEVRVFVGDREIRDIVRVETAPMIRESEQRQARRAKVGRAT